MSFRFREVPVEPMTVADFRRMTGNTPAIAAMSDAEVQAHIDDLRQDTVYLSSDYQVNLRALEPISADTPPMVHLSIKRRDKQPIHDWRVFQQIKNELVGPECEGVELYPAESRLVDSANQYHIWVIADPAIRFPFGFNERYINAASHGNVVQRPFKRGKK